MLVIKLAMLIALAPAFAAVVSAQTTGADQSPMFGGRNRENDQPKSVKDFLAKQRAEKAKRDHEELLKRGDELLQLTAQVEAAYERHNQLTIADRAKLDSVEKLAERIRKSLGGDNDEDEEAARAETKKPPETVKEAVLDLREVAIKLVDELKKTSRFSISVVAIQSSNSVVKLVRFLRLKK